MGKLFGFEFWHPTRAAKNKEREAEEQRKRVAAAAAHAHEMARIQEQQQLAHIAAVMLAAKAEIEAQYQSYLAESKEQYAQSHNDYVKAIDDVQQSQAHCTLEITTEYNTHIYALTTNQQNDEEYLSECYAVLGELLNELQEYSKTEPTQIQLNTVDITECGELVAELNQLLQDHDIDCIEAPQTSISVIEAIEVITAIQGKVAIVQQELHAQYESAMLELNAEFAQKLLESKDMHEQMLVQLEAQWLEYKCNHDIYVTSLAEHRDAQLNDINNQELQEIAKVEAAYQAHVAAINAEMQLRIKQIDDNLAAQTEHLKNSAKAFMITAAVMVGAAVAAYFSAGMLAGFSASVVQFVRATLAVTSLRAAERLANGEPGVSVDVSVNVVPQPKPYRAPVVTPKLNKDIAIENSEQKPIPKSKLKPAEVKSDKKQPESTSVNSTAERHKLLQEVYGPGYIPESSLATIGVVAVATAATEFVKDGLHAAGAVMDMCADAYVATSIFSASDTHRVEALQRNLERANNVGQAISNVVQHPNVITDYYKDRMKEANDSFATAFEAGDLVGAGKAMGNVVYDAYSVATVASGAAALTAKVATGAAKTATSFVAANKFVSPVTFQYKPGTLYSGIPFDAVEVRSPVVPKAPAASGIAPKLPSNAEKLTKSQIVDYLQNVDKLPAEQLYRDLQNMGFELYVPPQEGIYKFIHWRNDMRAGSPKPKLENSKIIIEVHKGKGGADLDHMHITDTHGNVYDKHLNNLTAKFRSENPDWHVRKLKREVESLPEAHIQIKEFVELNTRPKIE